MQKRQLRLNSPAQITAHLAELIGKKINIVLNDNTVVFGILSRVQPAVISVMNMRFKKIEIPISTVYEIYLDLDA